MNVNWDKGIRRFVLVLSLVIGIAAGFVVVPKIWNKWTEYLTLKRISEIQRTTPKNEIVEDTTSSLYKMFHGKYSALYEATPIGIDSFATIVKEGFPEYRDVHDTDLTVRVLNKFPYYKRFVDIHVPWIARQLKSESDPEISKRFADRLREETENGKYNFISKLLRGLAFFAMGISFPWLLYFISRFVVKGFLPKA